MNIVWSCKLFEALEVQELYDILRLRSEVFVVEQQCIFLDMDNKDQLSFHLMGYHEGTLVAYTRLVPAGVSYADFPSIGRVVSSPSSRGSGIGRQLMVESIRQLYLHFGKGPVKIGAQLYLQAFYESLGFAVSSAVYDEDGIPHVEMILDPG